MRRGLLAAVLALGVGCAVFSLSCSRRQTPEVNGPEVSVTVSLPVKGELAKLVMRLRSPNWHDRFEAALELKKRGHDTGLPVIQDGMRAKEWFVRFDAAHFAGLCEAVALISTVSSLLGDEHPAVASKADTVLASLVCAYPEPGKPRALAWKKWLEDNPEIDRVALIRNALVRVPVLLASAVPSDKVEGLMMLRALSVGDRVPKALALVTDGDPWVQATAIRLLDELVADNSLNASLLPLLASQSETTRGWAAIFLAARGETVDISWKLIDALKIPELTLRAHRLLLAIHGTGPVFVNPVEDTPAADAAELWRQWMITDEILRGIRPWEDGVKNTSPPLKGRSK